MNTQVTQKKKLTLKATKVEAPVEAGDGMVAVAPEPVSRPAGVDSGYHKVGAIVAIVTTLVFLVLIAVQAMEWLYYQSPPTVWAPTVPVAGAQTP